MDEKQRVFVENPSTNANPLSKLFFWWINPLLKTGSKRTLTDHDISKPVKHEEMKNLTDILEREWNKELLKKNPSLIKAVFRIFYVQILVMFIVVTIKEATRVVQPLLINNLIRYFKEPDKTLLWACANGFLLILCLVVFTLVHHPYFFACMRYGMQIRIAVNGLVYRKLLKIGHSEKKSNIEVINLLSNDSSRIEQSTYFLFYIIMGPLQAIAIVAILVSYVDYSILAGVLFILIVLPLQAFINRIMNYYKTKISRITDRRINLTAEILNGMKIIKMNCWEKPFKKIIDDIRADELKNQKMVFFITGINNFIEVSFPSIITYISIAVFIYATDYPLLPEYIILVISYYSTLCSTMGLEFMRGITTGVAGKVSFNRVKEYLLQSEVLKLNRGKDPAYGTSVTVNGMNADWKQENAKPFLNDITFKVESNELLAIVGEVGSGKSSLLMALLGELPNINGNININGSVFYVAQEPWIFSATVKQNILFGKEYNEQRFNEIISVCELKEDLAMFSYGENTMIGDKGVNLSGGQRARISLARAVYADADVYLLDDPLSAVDANVAKNLYNNCINGYLKSKVRILVTHQIHFLTNANQIILIKNGKTAASGTYSDLMLTKASELSMLMLKTDVNKKAEKTQEEIKIYSRPRSRVSESSSVIDVIPINAEPNATIDEDDDVFYNPKSITKNEKIKDNEYEEKQAIGTVDWKVYGVYLKAVYNAIVPIAILVIFSVSFGFQIFADYWISYWSNKELDADNIKVKLTNRNLYFYVYTGIHHHMDFSIWCLKFLMGFIFKGVIGSVVVTSIIKLAAFYAFCIIAAKNLHNRLISSVIETKIRFFDVNPIGRVINRFSKDIGTADEILPLALYDCLQYSVVSIGTIALAVSINYFVIIPIIPVGVLFYYIRRFCMKTTRQLKRIEALRRSPVYIHATNTASGIVTIRSCQNQEILLNEFNVHGDYHTQAFFTFISVDRWFALRLELVVLIYRILVVYVCIFARDYLSLKPSEVGILLVYIMQILSIFQWCIRQTAEVENNMTSVERINEYVTLEKEELGNASIKPNDKWPENGAVTFQNTSFAYDKNLPYVLKNVTFDINAREKVGVVGRTGAGKSTIFQTLFRMAEPDGTVLIDGVNIQDISLNDLRSKISIIPQEPTLFMGPLRYNLDPFCENEDKVLWDILDVVQLKDTVKNMQGGLDAQIQKGGSNLSVGQKQLFCLARAILKKSKILIIDEATANVDYKTDALVQKAIRKYFSDCTVITIAHRLHTIMDSDKIICLSDGQLIDYGVPYDLLQDADSILYKLINKLAKHEREHLYEIAKSHKYQIVINEELADYDDVDDFDPSKYDIKGSDTDSLTDDATSHHERF